MHEEMMDNAKRQQVGTVRPLEEHTSTGDMIVWPELLYMQLN
jgi:hypothetical protein